MNQPNASVRAACRGYALRQVAKESLVFLGIAGVLALLYVLFGDLGVRGRGEAGGFLLILVPAGTLLGAACNYARCYDNVLRANTHA
jgi:hypothetical protein